MFLSDQRRRVQRNFFKIKGPISAGEVICGRPAAFMDEKTARALSFVGISSNARLHLVVYCSLPSVVVQFMDHGSVPIHLFFTWLKCALAS